MKEELSSSETSVLTRATRRNFPEDTILHSLSSSLVPETQLAIMALKESYQAFASVTSPWYLRLHMWKRAFIQLHRSDLPNPAPIQLTILGTDCRIPETQLVIIVWYQHT
jgi:hypothetical protein